MRGNVRQERCWEKCGKIQYSSSKEILNRLIDTKKTGLSQTQWFRKKTAVNQTNYPSTFVRVGTPSAAATTTHITDGTFPLLAMV